MRLRTPEALWALSCRLHQNGWCRLARLIKALNWMMHKCLLPCEAIVGRNLLLEHYALGVVIHPQTIIGDDCRIFHQVTLAAESPIGSEHRIRIGKGVLIGAHAVIVARKNASLRIGDHSIIGAGSVVVGDIPENEVWAGNPARKIKDRTAS
ncbi:MAG TPA: DapH/DapD/GlmU-related protein [Terrimicrobiaceae bacterium]|nr:DapH/DapD/GlmU-related protein [Terrimicrobiaceae bacterium]